MTYTEYLRATDLPEHTEWVDGEVQEMMAVSRAHAEMQVYLVELLQAYLRVRPIGRLYLEPFQMKTGPELPGRAPDLMVVLEGSLQRLTDQYLDGPAELVVEIISQGTEATDRDDKFYEYEAGGVAEYWLIDPIREVADFFVRDDRGTFRASPERPFPSSILQGLRVDPEWLWERRHVLGWISDQGLEQA
jgi:Uma2 family endonuclease